ncbi:MAG TPA: glutathione S-transferase N-terminal domain-containing protein [Candidatus Binatia bacterium]|jgi:GST-like protein
MIDLYTWTTPNGRKVSILLEELGIPYRAIAVDIGQGEQNTPEFRAINPNGKIPAIVDHDAAGGPLAIFESGAIMIHLAEQHRRFLSSEPRARAVAMEWLMFQMSGIGPFLGQVNYWMNNAPEKLAPAIQRYLDESLRLMTVFNGALGGRDFIAGEYSIADMASYPWIAAAWTPFSAMMPDKVAGIPAIGAWLVRLGAREAVVRGMSVPKVG